MKQGCEKLQKPTPMDPLKQKILVGWGSERRCSRPCVDRTEYT